MDRVNVDMRLFAGVGRGALRSAETAFLSANR